MKPSAAKASAPPLYFENLDSIRGICALLVALFHTAWASNVRSIPFVANGWLFVDFFFVLSGFVITHTYAGQLVDRATAGAFLIRRFFRLYPLHFVTLILTMLLTVFGHGLRSAEMLSHALHDIGTAIVSADFTAALFLVHGLGFSMPTFNTASWSISTEFWTYIVFAAVAISCLTIRRTVATMAVAGTVSFALLFYLNYPKGLFTAYEFGFLRCLAGFSLGSVVWYAWSKSVWKPDNLSIGAMYALLIASMWSGLEVATLETYSNVVLLPVFAATVYVNAIDTGSPVKHLLESAPLRFIGRRSYSIYMVHTAILIIVSAMVSALAPHLRSTQPAALPIKSLLAGDAFCAAYVALILAVASLAYRWIEQPYQKKGKQLSLKLTPSAQSTKA